MFTIAIIGAGFSGTVLAVHLLEQSDADILLVERRGVFGRGLAYSTPSPEHRLNVRAGNMSARPDRPDDFSRWLTAAGQGDRATEFVGRPRYGDYLAALLDAAERAHPGRLRRCTGHATALDEEADGFHVVLADGTRLAASAVVLASGNAPPADLPGLSDAGLPPGRYVADPWAEDYAAGLHPEDEVALVGTGLTMADVVLHLRAQGFQGRITALSRHGLLPRAHDGSPRAQGLEEPLPVAPLAALLRAVRARAGVIGWRGAVDELRPVTQAMWRRAPAAVRARFLRHLRPWWDVHRHRLAPDTAARLEQEERDGLLRVEAGRLAGRATLAEGGVVLRWRPRGGDTTRKGRFTRIINCTGPQADPRRTREPLLRGLLDRGAGRPDAHHLGLDVTGRGELLDRDGVANPRLFALGPPTLGAFWEIIAVPDIRVQGQALARHLADQAAAEQQGPSGP